jgi:hypothetical protein
MKPPCHLLLPTSACEHVLYVYCAMTRMPLSHYMLRLPLAPVSAFCTCSVPRLASRSVTVRAETPMSLAFLTSARERVLCCDSLLSLSSSQGVQACVCAALYYLAAQRHAYRCLSTGTFEPVLNHDSLVAHLFSLFLFFISVFYSRTCACGTMA